jgi:hypothetical protein
MTGAAQFAEVFDRLVQIFSPYRASLVAKIDEPVNLYLETPPSPTHPQGFYFGGVRLGKRYVSVYLMPIYVYPELLTGLSSELQKRRQGKSCFNFTRADDELVAELSGLTAAGFARFQEDGKILVG